MRVYGHSGQAEYGSDIVCAAVSALVVATANGLSQVCGIKGIEESAESGAAFINVPKTLSPAVRREADILFDTLLLALKDIQEAYPEALCIQ